MRSTPRTDPAADPAVDRAPTDRAPTDRVQAVRRKLADAWSAWPLRRLVAVAVLAPLMFVLWVSVSGGWALASPGWTALVALVALASATTLGSYLPRPGTGMRFELGCTPCAAVAALSVLVSLGLLNSSPHDVTTAILALGVAAFGLRQRLTNPSTCPA